MKAPRQIAARLGGVSLALLGAGLLAAVAAGFLPKALPAAIDAWVVGSFLATLGVLTLIAGIRVARDAIAGRASGPSPVFPRETSLLMMPALVPRGFTAGVEILNDTTTPMAFVVKSLARHLAFDQETAIRAMLAIHRKGGILIPTASLEDAERAVDAIAADARAEGHPLVCRAVAR